MSVGSTIPGSGRVAGKRGAAAALRSFLAVRVRRPGPPSLAALGLASVIGLNGCAPLNPPANHSPELFSPEASSRLGRSQTLTYMSKVCPPAGTPDFMVAGPSPKQRPRDHDSLTMRYSPGDRFNVFVFGSQDFSGDYVINADGTVVLPYAGPVEALGLTNVQLSSRISDAYVKSGIFIKDGLKLTIRPVQFAPINVSVAGAVFFPGRHAIGGIKDSDKLDRALAKYGDAPMDRFVPAALRVAGGVRPDADLSAVKVTRRGRTFVLDWRGAITGAPVDDMPLVEGDHVEVGETGCFQSALVRPSQVTPPGVRIFTSNLTQPLANWQAGNPQLANSMPYGTRLLQGLVQANCVGGALATNARRYAVLISRNPKTRETEVVQRPVEELVRSAHRDTINPYLMPDDAIACYDSGVTEFRDVMSVIGGALAPVQIGKTIIK